MPFSAVKDLPDLDNDPFDPELGIIIDLLTPRLKGLEKAEEPITFVTYQVAAHSSLLTPHTSHLTPHTSLFADQVARIIIKNFPATGLGQSAEYLLSISLVCAYVLQMTPVFQVRQCL